jgi:hypothetical protein
VFLDNRFQVLIRDRLDNVPIFIKHPDVTPAVAHALLRVIERKLPAACTIRVRAIPYRWQRPRSLRYRLPRPF